MINKYLYQGFSPSYMRGIVFYIKVSRPAIWEELYFTSRLLGQLYERNCILHQGFSPAIWEELYFTSRFLAQLYERNCILHQGFSTSYMRGIVFYIKASRPAIWEELYFTPRPLPSYMRGIVFYSYVKMWKTFTWQHHSTKGVCLSYKTSLTPPLFLKLLDS
jgi:hypothetical protein